MFVAGRDWYPVHEAEVTKGMTDIVIPFFAEESEGRSLFQYSAFLNATPWRERYV